MINKKIIISAAITSAVVVLGISGVLIYRNVSASSSKAEEKVEYDSKKNDHRSTSKAKKELKKEEQKETAKTEEKKQNVASDQKTTQSVQKTEAKTTDKSQAKAPEQKKEVTRKEESSVPEQKTTEVKQPQKVWVVDTAAYDEPKWEIRDVGVKCRDCGRVFNTYNEWKQFVEAEDEKGNYSHGSYSVVQESVQNGTIHHDEVGHWEYR
ncbi:MAG: hypothetical protein K5851_03505 [Lachnospiraceae bacterium]|nr:hypothetical protein [Lachnospiraceae bacterium]